MNREDIIRMAQEAGFFIQQNEIYSMSTQSDQELTEWIERFAALVASAEREACAKLCDDHCGWTPRMIGSTIRARGNVATNDTSQERVDETSESVHEPVACKECHLKDTVYDLLGDLKVANLKLSVWGKRTWVGLTEEDKESFWTGDQMSQKEWDELYAEVEAKLKEKNGL